MTVYAIHASNVGIGDSCIIQKVPMDAVITLARQKSNDINFFSWPLIKIVSWT